MFYEILRFLTRSNTFFRKRTRAQQSKCSVCVLGKAIGARGGFSAPKVLGYD